MNVFESAAKLLLVVAFVAMCLFIVARLVRAIYKIVTGGKE